MTIYTNIIFNSFIHIFHIYGMKSLSQSEINFFVHLSAGSSSKIKKKKGTKEGRKGDTKKKNRKKQRNNKQNMKT